MQKTVNQLISISRKVIFKLIFCIFLLFHVNFAMSLENSIDTELSECREELLKLNENRPNYCNNLSEQIIDNSNQLKYHAEQYNNIDDSQRDSIIGNAQENVALIFELNKQKNERCINFKPVGYQKIADNMAKEIIKKFRSNDDTKEILERYAQELKDNNDNDVLCLKEPKYDDIPKGCVDSDKDDPLMENIELKLDANIQKYALELSNEENADSDVTKIEEESIADVYEKRFEFVLLNGFCDNAMDNIANNDDYKQCVENRIEKYKANFNSKSILKNHNKSALENWNELGDYYGYQLTSRSRPDGLWYLMEYHDRLISELEDGGLKYSFFTLVGLQATSEPIYLPILSYDGNPHYENLTNKSYSEALNEILYEISSRDICDESQILFLYILKKYNYTFFIDKLNLSNKVDELYKRCTTEKLLDSTLTTSENMLKYFDEVSENGQYNYNVYIKNNPDLLPKDNESLDSATLRVRQVYVSSAKFQKFKEIWGQIDNCFRNVDIDLVNSPSTITGFNRFINLSMLLDEYDSSASWLDYNKNVRKCSRETYNTGVYYFTNNYIEGRISLMRTKKFLSFRELGDLYAYSDPQLCNFFGTCNQKELLRTLFVEKTSPSWAMKFKNFQREQRSMSSVFYDKSHLYDVSILGSQVDLGFVVKFFEGAKKSPLPLRIIYDFTLGLVWDAASDYLTAISGEDELGNKVLGKERAKAAFFGTINYAFAVMTVFDGASIIKTSAIAKKVEAAKEATTFLRKEVEVSSKMANSIPKSVVGEVIKEDVDMAKVMVGAPAAFDLKTVNEVKQHLKVISDIYNKLKKMKAEIKVFVPGYLYCGVPVEPLVKIFQKSYATIRLSIEDSRINRLAIKLVSELADQGYNAEQIATMARMIPKIKASNFETKYSYIKYIERAKTNKGGAVIINDANIISNGKMTEDAVVIYSHDGYRVFYKDSSGKIKDFKVQTSIAPPYIGHENAYLIRPSDLNEWVLSERKTLIAELKSKGLSKDAITRLSEFSSKEFFEYMADVKKIISDGCKNCTVETITEITHLIYKDINKSPRMVFDKLVEFAKERKIETHVFSVPENEVIIKDGKFLLKRDPRIRVSAITRNWDEKTYDYYIRIPSSYIYDKKGADAIKAIRNLTDNANKNWLEKAVLNEKGEIVGSQFIFYNPRGELDAIFERLGIFNTAQIGEARRAEFEKFLADTFNAKVISSMGKSHFTTDMMADTFSSRLAKAYIAYADIVKRASIKIRGRDASAHRIDTIISHFCNNNETDFSRYVTEGFNSAVAKSQGAHAVMPIGVAVGSSGIYLVEPKASDDANNYETNNEPYLLFQDFGPSKLMCLEGNAAEEARLYFGLEAEKLNE